MSRVDEDREAARAAERIALQKREAEAKAKSKTVEDNAFSKLVKQGQDASRQAQAQKTQKDNMGRSAIAALLEREGVHESAEAHAEEAGHLTEKERAQDGDLRGRARHGLKGLDDRLKQANTSEGERATKDRGADQEVAGQAFSGRTSDRAGEGSRAEGRKGDAKTSRESLEERKEGAQAGAGAKAGGARFGKGELKADADKGGGGQGGQKKDDPAQPMGPGFRFNPALMAPMPVQQAKPNSGSDRLRALANEIAQKIVERVRVGTNAAGKSEFQIDLRSNVLSGLQIKVSGSNGKISAVFSGSDREVMKMLREQADGLKAALTGRGLTLEEFRIEEK